ncbi:MAG: ribonuclease HI [Planctomycetota bacterium]
MSHNRALQNPPVAVPRVGLPSHRALIATDYLLVCEAQSSTLDDGYWRFSLEAADGTLIMEADDREFGDLNRLTLLAAVRGLEAIEGASRVTLLSTNRYLIRSLSNALPRWRQNDFRWEHFGRRIEVQHADLWRRVDGALAIHRVQACLISTCLVSEGVEEDRPTSETPNLRVDTSHSHRPSGAVPPPSDRLRGLLMGDRTNSDNVPVTSRR